MRLRSLIALTFAGLGVAALGATPALAQTFPDLPGMGSAERATGADATHVAEGSEAPDADAEASPDSAPAPPPRARSVAGEAVSPEDIEPIRSLPGGGSLPIVNEAGLASFSQNGERSEAEALPSGLAALAGLGTLISVGAFVALRDRLVDR